MKLVHDKNAFKVGDKVRVIGMLPYDENVVSGWPNSWVDSMDEFYDKEFIINESVDQNGIALALSDNHINFRFPSCVLELVDANPETDKGLPDSDIEEMFKRISVGDVSMFEFKKWAKSL